MSSDAVSNGKARAWTFADVQVLRRLAGQATAQTAAAALGRTVKAVQAKAMKCGISFRPVQPAAVRAKE